MNLFAFFVVSLIIGVGLVAYAEAYGPPHPMVEYDPLTVGTSQETYGLGEPITITGKVGRYSEGEFVRFIIYYPNGRVAAISHAVVQDDKSFSLMITDTKDFDKEGQYHINLQYDKFKETADASFFVDFSKKIAIDAAEIENGYDNDMPKYENVDNENNDESPKIPIWIKTNAKWWSEGQIKNSDFISGIQYLIEKQIITLSHEYESSSSGDQTQEIPKWVRNNAGWWADGLISDDDFLMGIKHLIEKNIVKISQKTSMKISSKAFEDNELIPPEYTCDGQGISPGLILSNVPSNAKSLALVMDDPDAPMGTFVHWLVWNISPEKNTIAEGENLIAAVQGRTDFGKQGYGGPCPPSGTHRYYFKLYALDTVLDIVEGSAKKDLEKAMEGHVIEQATLIGKYSRVS